MDQCAAPDVEITGELVEKDAGCVAADRTKVRAAGESGVRGDMDVLVNDGRVRCVPSATVAYVACGGSSWVYKCTVKSGVRVVVKVTAGGGRTNSRGDVYYVPNNMTFLKEYLVMLRLSGHSWVPTLCGDVFKAVDTPFVQWKKGTALASEYLSALMYTSDRQFWEHAEVGWEHATSYLSQLLSLGADLYALGFEHRDMKPGNLVHTRFYPMHLKLLDFGGCTMRSDYKVAGKVQFNKVELSATTEWVREAVLVAARLDHITFTKTRGVEWYHDYVEWPLQRDNFLCVGGVGTMGYRCRGDVRRPPVMSDDSWAVGALVLGVVSAGASRRVATLWRDQRMTADSSVLDCEWTVFVQTNVCGASDAEWLRWMDRLWWVKRDRSEAAVSLVPEGACDVVSDAVGPMRKVRGVFVSELRRNKEYMAVLNVLRKLLMDHQGCAEAHEFWLSACHKIAQTRL
jgi:hypothetical protein